MKLSWQALQKKLRKSAGAQSAEEKKAAKAEERQAAKDAKAVGALCTKVHRSLQPLVDSMIRLEKKMEKNSKGLDESQIQIFKDSKSLVEEWLAETKVVLGNISKGVQSKVSDISYTDDKMVAEQVKSCKDCMKAINLRYAEQNPKPKAKAKAKSKAA